MMKKEMSNIAYIKSNEKKIDSVRPLWEKLNKHMISKSTFFSEKYKKRRFEDRKYELLRKNAKMRIDFVKDLESDTFVGYCISTINKDKEGIIESIYIEEEYRGRGIGDCLMKRHLEWMDKKGVMSKKLTVTVGNEEVFCVYKRYGFYPKLTELEQIPSCNSES